MRKTTNNFAIFCDWLQIHVKANENFLEFENPYYSFKRTGQSKIWKNIYAIYSTTLGHKVAEYCTDANECIMKRGYGVLKMENNQLYCHEDLNIFIETFLHRLNFKFISITRLDIAFDIQKFYLDYEPMALIKRYAEHKVIKVGASRKTSSIMFKQHNRYHEFETLYFGSKKSDLQIKMYNKTAQLKAECKPYISSIHKDIFQNDKDVWRIEFSIYSLSKAMLENYAGEKFDYNSLDVLKIKNLYGIYIGLFEKHFQWRTCGKQKRIARMKPLNLWLFDLDVLKLNLKKQNELIKISSRSERVFLKQLSEITDSKISDEKKAVYEDIFSYAVKKLGIKNYKNYNLKGNQDKEDLHFIDETFLRSVKKRVANDRPTKIILSKLKKVLDGKDYDEKVLAASHEITGKLISEYQLQDFAIKKDIFYKGFENYIFEVEQFKRIAANHEKLDIDFANAKAAANEAFINDLCLHGEKFYNE